MKDFKIGDNIYVVPIGNMTRYYSEPIESKIKYIGRKYFTIDGYMFYRMKFSLEDMMNVTVFSKDWRVYNSLEELHDEKESKYLCMKIRERFNRISDPGISIENIREIAKILNIEY